MSKRSEEPVMQAMVANAIHDLADAQMLDVRRSLSR
jgi:hypothetical protein